MKIIYLQTVPSTQIYLESAIKGGKLTAPICVWTLEQTSGIGSRESIWQSPKGNLAFSFALAAASLPSDLPPQSASIYFGWIFKETLAAIGSKIWLKWPNDLYLDGKKAGGVITKLFNGVFLCGIGLNIVSPSGDFAQIDTPIDPEKVLADYLRDVERVESWGAIFSRYRLEYQRSSRACLRARNCGELSSAYTAHSEHGVFNLEDAVLEDDGSVLTRHGKVYSQR